MTEEPRSKTVRLEGRLTGPWVSECERCWQMLVPSLGSKTLRVDLRGVTHIDANGKQLLMQIHKGSAAEFLADTPMTKYFAEEARGQSQSNTRGEK